MRRFLPAFLLFSIYSHAQVRTDSLVALSRLEKAIISPGNFVKISQQFTGTVDEIAIGVITGFIVDSSSSMKRNVICFKPKSYFLQNVFDLSDLHIDEEELDDVIRIVESMNKLADDKTVKSPESFTYTTSNLVVFSLTNRRSNYKKWDLRISKWYRYLQAEMPGTYCAVNGIYLEDLYTLLKKVKDKLATH